jgi:chromosomal replication initiator protein
MDEVQIIPFSGQPLEYDCSEASRMVLPVPERGFLLGRENYVLHPAVQWAVDGTAPPENLPIFFYGPVGSGRTHLLQGILDAWRKNQSSDAVRRRSFYLPAADFARHFTESLETKTTDVFRRQYRRAALLLIDDIEQLYDKPPVLVELRHTLDELIKNGGTVILTANSLPGESDLGKNFSCSEDLVARIIGGTTLPIFLPGEAVRRRFLREIAVAFRIPLSEAVLQTVARELPVSLPQLYGMVAQMYFEATADNIKIDSAHWLRFLKRRQCVCEISVADIAKQTAKYFSLKLSDLKGDSRSKNIVLARSIAVYLTRCRTRLQLKEIGKFFGKRDPSTIRHLLEKIQNEIAADPMLRDHLFRLGLR